VRRRLGEDGGEMKARNIEIFQTISKLCKTSIMNKLPLKILFIYFYI